MSRAIRRHHARRMRVRAFRNLIAMYSSSWFDGSPFYPAPDNPVDENHPWVYLRANNFTVCSCSMWCQNPRRARGWRGPVRTRQERKSELDLRDWVRYNEH